MDSMKQELVELKASSASFNTNTAQVRDLAIDLSSLKVQSTQALSRMLTDTRMMVCF
jgi:hypothetical protein